MYRAVLAFAAALCLALAGGACRQEQLSTEKVTTLLDSLEQKLGWLDYRLALEQWQLDTEGNSDSLASFERLYTAVVTDEAAYRTLQQGERLLEDEVDRRRAELMLSRLTLERIERHPEVTALHQPAERPFVGGGIMPGELLTAVLTGADTEDAGMSRSRREAAFLTRSGGSRRASELMPRLIRLRNQLARRRGFNDYFALSLKSQGIDRTGYLDLLERLDQATEPRYLALLDSMSAALGSAVEIWDLGLLQRAGSRAGVMGFLPRDSQFVIVERSLAGIGFDLDRLPIYFDGDRMAAAPSPVECRPVMPPYDVRLVGHYLEGPAWTNRLMQQVGRALHATHTAQDDAVFGRWLHPVWRNGVAATLALMCHDPVWLQEYAHVPPSAAGRYAAARRDAELVALRVLLMHLTFEYEAYADSDRDLNQLYWDLVEHQLLLPRHDEVELWVDVEPYERHPVQLYSVLYGKIVAAQTLAYLDDQYGGLIDNSEAYSFLVQNYMRLGSRYPWRDLLQRGTEESLNPEHYLVRLGL